MFKHLLRQFYLTRAERNGAVALLLLAGASWIAPAVYRHFRPAPQTDFSAFAHLLDEYASTVPSAPPAGTGVALAPFDPNTASVETFVGLGLAEKTARTIVKYRERGGRFRSAADLQKIYSLPAADFERLRPFVRIGEDAPQHHSPQLVLASMAAPELFSFDPNTATEADLRRLGLPPALVGRLLKYREKGGFFYDKKGFSKLYGLTETEFLRLEPYLAIAKRETAPRPATYAGGGNAAGPAVEAAPVDINTATPDDWQRLPGVGAVRAYKIVRYREKLGGFVAVAQVAETAGLPDSIFQKMVPRLRLGVPVFRQINLNTATADELVEHPYFSRKQAQLIVHYREQHGPFGRVEDIARIAAFSDAAWLAKISPYLIVQ